MGKEILLPAKAKTELIRDFNTTNVTLWNALTFKTNSSFAKMLRKAALERGGVISGSNYGPEIVVNDVEGTIILVFTHRVKMICDSVNRFAGVFVDDNLKVKYPILSPFDLIKIQKRVAEEARKLDMIGK